MLRRFGQLLPLSVALLAGCNFDAVPIGPVSSLDAGSQPASEDELLRLFGLQLAGSWRGLATMENVFGLLDVYMLLEWTPDANQPRSGQLRIRCVPGALNCTPAANPSVLDFRYSLYEMTEPGTVKGALEVFEEEGMVTALGTLELTLRGPELSFYSSGAPLFSFVSLTGTFLKDPLPVPTDAGLSFPGPSP